MARLILIALTCVSFAVSFAAEIASAQQPPRLRVRAGATYLETTEGKPFFWLGDTVWSGPAVATLDDWNTYLADRKAKHFSVIQFNAVCPWRVNPTDADGQTAYSGRDPITINDRYFERLDKYFDAIEKHGLVAAPVLLWANKKGDAGTELSEDDAVRLARYQVDRYKGRSVVWILAGDNRYTAELSARWQRIGRKVFADQPDAVVTTHPTGMNWPWDQHGWRDEKWLSFLGYQSGHGDDVKTLAWIHSGPVSKAWRTEPVRPIINLEPPYEDHVAYQSKQPHSAYSVRRAAYWSMLNAPPAGLTYGAHGIWSWQTESGKVPADHGGSGVAKSWREAMDLPGSAQMGYLAELFQSLEWWKLRPFSPALRGTADGPPEDFIGFALDGGRQQVIYFPEGRTVDIGNWLVPNSPLYVWFDPRNGKRTVVKPDSAGKLPAPSEEDWVLLVLEGKGP